MPIKIDGPRPAGVLVAPPDRVAEAEDFSPTWLRALWSWSEGEIRLRPLPAWLLCTGAVLIFAAAFLPLILSYARFAFYDAGSGLAANDLLAHGLLPAVDFGYYHGLLPLIIGRLWFGILGPTPQAYVALQILLAIFSLILMFHLLRTIRAQRSAYLMLLAAIPFSFFYRPSLNHDLAATALTLSLLLLVRRNFAGAGSAAMASAFCHPSLGWVMFGMVPLTYAWWLISGPRPETRARVCSVAGSWLAATAATFAVYAGLCFVFFRTWKPMLLTLFPLVGGGVRSHYKWSFLNGGLMFLHPPGSNWKYMFGTTAGAYLLFNLALLAAALAWLILAVRKRQAAPTPMLVLIFCSLIIHWTYLVFAFGVPQTWSYDSYLLVLALAALPFAAARHFGALVLAAALMIGYTSGIRTAFHLYHFKTERGLWIDEQTSADLGRILQESPGSKPYVWSMSGALGQIDDRYQSPARWFVVPGTNPPGELNRLKQDLLFPKRVFLRGLPEDPGSLFQNQDFAGVLKNLREVGRIGAFVVYEQKSPPVSSLR